jgi:hypothetical protein
MICLAYIEISYFKISLRTPTNYTLGAIKEIRISEINLERKLERVRIRSKMKFLKGNEMDSEISLINFIKDDMQELYILHILYSFGKL